MKQRKNIEKVSSFGNIIASSVFTHDELAIASNDSNCDVKTKKNKERERVKKGKISYVKDI